MEKTYSYSFEKLNVWQDARLLVKNIYILVLKLPKEEKYALVDQLKRASVSVSSNIAEGNSRSSYKEKIRFIEIGYGSLLEIYSQLILSVDLNYLCENDILEINQLIQKISNELNALKKSYSKQISK